MSSVQIALRLMAASMVGSLIGACSLLFESAPPSLEARCELLGRLSSENAPIRIAGGQRIDIVGDAEEEFVVFSSNPPAIHILDSQCMGSRYDVVARTIEIQGESGKLIADELAVIEGDFGPIRLVASGVFSNAPDEPLVVSVDISEGLSDSLPPTDQWLLPRTISQGNCTDEPAGPTTVLSGNFDDQLSTMRKDDLVYGSSRQAYLLQTDAWEHGMTEHPSCEVLNAGNDNPQLMGDSVRYLDTAVRHRGIAGTDDIFLLRAFSIIHLQGGAARQSINWTQNSRDNLDGGALAQRVGNDEAMLGLGWAVAGEGITARGIYFTDPGSSGDDSMSLGEETPLAIGEPLANAVVLQAGYAVVFSDGQLRLIGGDPLAVLDVAPAGMLIPVVILAHEPENGPTRVILYNDAGTEQDCYQLDPDGPSLRFCPE